MCVSSVSINTSFCLINVLDVAGVSSRRLLIDVLLCLLLHRIVSVACFVQVCLGVVNDTVIVYYKNRQKYSIISLLWMSLPLSKKMYIT